MDENRKLRVMVVEGWPLIRLGLVTLSNLHPRLEVCAEAADGPTARRLCAEEKPDLIVLNLAIPRGDGIELLRDFHKLHPPARMLVVSDREDALSLERAFRAGAGGYVSMREEPTEVFAGLERLMAGERFASKRVSHLLLEHLASGPGRKGPRWDVATLSDRELQIFRLLGAKLGATAIAQELGISVRTIETHQMRMKEKLHVATGAALHRLAEEWASRLNGSRKTPAAATGHGVPVPAPKRPRRPAESGVR